jgi:hypothetical protein
MAGNLPTTPQTGPVSSKEFFDKFFVQKVSFPAAEIDATVGFFMKRGFAIDGARTTAIVLLNQARLDNVSVFALLDTMKTLTDVQMSQVVAQILNAYREKTSLLGYRIAPVVNLYESRNILV